MVVVFTKFHQVGLDLPLQLFEAKLGELAHLVVRPTPEIKGAHITTLIDGELSWLVVCTVRGGVVLPLSEDFQVNVIEKEWGDGILMVAQEALARLAYHHRQQLEETQFRFFGRRHEEGYVLQA